MKRGRNHGSDRVGILGHRVAGDRLDDALGIRLRDPSLFNASLVSRTPLQVGTLKRRPISGRLVTNWAP